MGNILFFGPYTPNPNGSPPSQTFTVTIPAGTQKGRAQLGVAHLALIGVSSALTPGSAKCLLSYDLGWFCTIPRNFEHHSQYKLIPR